MMSAIEGGTRGPPGHFWIFSGRAPRFNGSHPLSRARPGFRRCGSAAGSETKVAGIVLARARHSRHRSTSSTAVVCGELYSGPERGQSKNAARGNFRARCNLQSITPRRYAATRGVPSRNASTSRAPCARWPAPCGSVLRVCVAPRGAEERMADYNLVVVVGRLSALDPGDPVRRDSLHHDVRQHGSYRDRGAGREALEIVEEVRGRSVTATSDPSKFGLGVRVPSAALRSCRSIGRTTAL